MGFWTSWLPPRPGKWILVTEAQPGKILHEMRRGEMAALGEVPFGWYYGTVDATPLFVMLAKAYFARTGDLAFIEKIWPHIDRALHWINAYGDCDGDGFVEYSRQSKDGLVQQGWKDSNDSVFHADGTLATGPIALCEVQGYVYAAKRGAADLAALLGKREQAAALESEAANLRTQFNAAFWCEDIGTYAIALDGRKQPCRVRSSNAGHCLYTGIADADHAYRGGPFAAQPGFLLGLGNSHGGQRRGPIQSAFVSQRFMWPHDNALIAAGLARYGFKDMAGEILSALLAVSTFVDLASPAGALLWPGKPQPRRTNTVSRGVRSSGLGRRSGVPVIAILPGLVSGCGKKTDSPRWTISP